MITSRAAVAGATVLTFVACSSGGGNAAPAVGSAFARRAVAVCREIKELKDAEGPFPYPNFNPTQPDASKFPEVADALEKTDATFTAWLADMRALGQPPSGRDAWSELLAAIATHVRINRDQIAAAREGDSERFASDYEEGVETQAKLLDAATEAGVPECAEVDR
jgi:hypothetical protein